MQVTIKTHSGEIITGRLESVNVRKGLYAEVVNIHAGAVIKVWQETYEVKCKHCNQLWELKRSASAPRKSYCSKKCADESRKMLKCGQRQRRNARIKEAKSEPKAE
jgi:hypothetical protein